MSGVKILLAMAVLCLGALNSIGWAQSSRGVIVGSITDRMGAAAKGAEVKIVNIDTNITRKTVAMGEGSYRFDAVDPGVYRVEVSLSSSWAVAREQVIVAAGQTTEVSFKLALGSMRDLVNVPADTTVILQTQDGARTHTITERQITDLPLSLLNPSELVLTLPGVVDPGVLARGNVQGPKFSINGMRPRSNSQLIDGTENNDLTVTGQAYMPSLREGFQEVSVLGGDNSAEYGRAGGAVVNLISRSGGNRYHGSVYDIVAPSALFSLSSGQKINERRTSVPVSIQNQYGFSFGGPIKRDRLFFFGTFQGSPYRTTAAAATAVVPTQAGNDQLRGLFATGPRPNLDRYLSIVGNLRGSNDPARQVLVPLGGGRAPVPFGQVSTTTVSQRLDNYQSLGRIDWTPTSKDSFAFRHLYNHSLLTNQIPSAFDGYGIDTPSRSQNFHFSYTRVLSSRWINEYRFAYGRFVAMIQPSNPDVALGGPQFLFTGTPISSVGLDQALPQGRTLNNFQFQDTVTYTQGDHTVRAGMDLVRQTAKLLVPFNNRGTLNFTANPPPAGTVAGPDNYPAFGNFIDGFSGTQGAFANRVFGSPVIYPSRFQQAYFVDETWRLRSNLTLKLGLRYENFGTPSNVLPYPAFAGFDVPITTRVEQIPDNNNFAPRFSFAYTPRWGGRFFGQDQTVIRGGYAVSYDVFFDNILANTAASSPNVLGTTTLGGAAGGRGIANAGVNSLPTVGTLDPRAMMFTIDPNLVNPMVHTWNLGVQHQFPRNLIVDVAYVGTRGSSLFLNQDLNFGINRVQPIPTRGLVLMRTNAGDSNYHSLQARLERGLSKGVFFRFAYTYSKAIDNVNSDVNNTTGGSSRASDPFNLRADRSVASFDIPHRFAWTSIWNLPGPKNGWMGQMFGGWSMSSVYTLQAGAVETPYVGGLDLNGDLNAANDRPAIYNSNAPRNSVAIANSICPLLFAASPTPPPPSPTGYCTATGAPIQLANAYYVVDPTIRTNIAGRNSLRANWTNRLDAGISKSFAMPYEGHRLEVRMEIFNVLNNANYTWARPGTSDLSNGNVLNRNFNNVGLNDGGIPIPVGIGLTAGRAARFQIRYSF